MRGFSWGMTALVATATLAVAGCGPFPGERDRMDTGPTSEEFVFIRTSHARYFYLVDTWRGLCYFGDRGFPQLTPIACSELPEARDILGPAAATDPVPGDEAGAETPVEPGDEAETEAIPDDGLPAGDAAAEDLGAAPTEAETSAFSEAYVELACAARADGGAGVDTAARQAILSRHNLEEARYLQVRARLSQDRDLWLAISAAIQQRCP